ncbi:MAG: hypothetical protein ACLQSW_05645, partial [Syntrophobacteraceae bacterium]
ARPFVTQMQNARSMFRLLYNIYAAFDSTNSAIPPADRKRQKSGTEDGGRGREARSGKQEAGSKEQGA